MTVEDKIIIAKWYIANFLCLGPNQTISKQINDIKALEDIIKKDPWSFVCDQCIHNNSSCNKCIESNKKDGTYHSGFAFKYKQWQNFMKKNDYWEEAVKKFGKGGKENE